MLRRSLALSPYSLSFFKFNIPSDHRKLIDLCKPETKKYVSNSVVTLLHSGLFMYLPKIYGDINYLMGLKIGALNQSEILLEYGLMMSKWSVVFGLIGFLTYRRRYDFLDISNRIGIRMRLVLFKQLMNSDLYKKNAAFQTYLHHIVTDVQTISTFTGESVFFALRGLFFLLGGTCCLLYQSPLICMIAAVTMTAFNLYYRPRNIKLRNLKEQENQQLIQLSQHIAERLHNIRLVKISHTEAIEQIKLNQALKIYYEYAKKVTRANGFNFASLESLGLMSLFTIVMCGSLLTSLEISNFSLLASSTYALYASLGFRSLMFYKTELMKILGIYKIIEEKIGAVHEHPDYRKPFDELQVEYLEYSKKIQIQSSELSQKSSGVSLRIEGLSFDYMINDTPYNMYTNFNEKINAGDVVALVGPSGVGKSTLLNLITKLSPPTAGNIYFDDMPLSLMTFQDIQHNVSYVTQENFLFRGTVRENLIYGNQGFDCSEENLLSCLKLTNAYGFVMSKGGLQATIDTKGTNFSGGQRQRIILARALVKHPRLLLMDEATAGIDSTSEKIIIENLRNQRKGMTIIIITHKVDNFVPIITKYIELKSRN